MLAPYEMIKSHEESPIKKVEIAGVSNECRETFNESLDGEADVDAEQSESLNTV